MFEIGFVLQAMSFAKPGLVARVEREFQRQHCCEHAPQPEYVSWLCRIAGGFFLDLWGPVFGGHLLPICQGLADRLGLPEIDQRELQIFCEDDVLRLGV
jgi:hypothetical protein